MVAEMFVFESDFLPDSYYALENYALLRAPKTINFGLRRVFFKAGASEVTQTSDMPVSTHCCASTPLIRYEDSLTRACADTSLPIPECNYIKSASAVSRRHSTETARFYGKRLRNSASTEREALLIAALPYDILVVRLHSGTSHRIGACMGTIAPEAHWCVIYTDRPLEALERYLEAAVVFRAIVWDVQGFVLIINNSLEIGAPGCRAVPAARIRTTLILQTVLYIATQATHYTFRAQSLFLTTIRQPTPAVSLWQQTAFFSICRLQMCLHKPPIIFNHQNCHCRAVFTLPAAG